MSFDNIMDLFAHEFEMHPLSSWYEEVEESQMEPEIVIPDIALADYPDLEFNIHHPEKRKAEEDLQSQPKRITATVSNPQVGAGYVEPEKEKNPQPENNVVDNVCHDHVDRSEFNERLFTRQYKHRGSNDILVAGQQYKERIMRLLDHYVENHGSVSFFMVYQCRLLKYNPDGEEEYADVYFHSRNRRMLSMDEFEENYEDAIDTINGKLGNYMAESSGWMMDSILNKLSSAQTNLRGGWVWAYSKNLVISGLLI